MNRIRRDQQLVASVLDRLIDEEPEKQVEQPKSRNQLLRDLKKSVGRDLENLLNTRWRCATWPPNQEELDSSLANYGVPDFGGVNFGAGADRERLRQVIEQVIRRFETRFQTVKVSLLTNANELDRTLRLRIDAKLYAEPAPEPVVFDSQLEPTSGDFEVTSSSR